MKANSDKKWFLIVVIESLDLPGASLFRLIMDLLAIRRFNFVVVDDIIGAGVQELVEMEKIIFGLSQLLMILPSVVQFDWGDFYIFENQPKDFILNTELKYPEIISQTDTTIRAVDDQFFYVYTPFEDVVDLIKLKYDVDFIHHDTLDNLEYPF